MVDRIFGEESIFDIGVSGVNGVVGAIIGVVAIVVADRRPCGVD